MGPGSSRDATDELLNELRAGRWRLHSWGRFLGQASARSWNAARLRPRAAAELTALHIALAVLSHRAGRKPGWRWITGSWVLSITHLGLLESRRSIRTADVVTLVRGNLPALGPENRITAVCAVASDVVDGWLARRRRIPSPFGRYADSLADAAFWVWFASRHESRKVASLAVGVWIGPVAAVVVASVARGRMIDPLRHELARPAAMMQVVLALRALVRGLPNAVGVNGHPDGG